MLCSLCEFVSRHGSQCVRSAFTRSSDRPGAPPPVLHVFTKRAIEVGEELRWNYGEKYWDREDRVAE